MTGQARRPGALQVAGELLLTAGVLVLLFVAYELSGTGVSTGRAQAALGEQLARTLVAPVAAAPAPPALGSAYARLSLPSLGRAHTYVVVEGVERDDLRRGPGHLPGSAAPGQPGNTVIAGHRTTYGAPFGDLDRLAVGDPVVVQTRSGTAVFRVTGRQVVAPDAVEVTWPVPGDAGADPARSLITLTTCHPRWSAAQRLVVRGELES